LIYVIFQEYLEAAALVVVVAVAPQPVAAVAVELLEQKCVP
jgi:hypothetical protein